MPRAVTFAAYGGSDVLEIVTVERPTAGDGQVLVRVHVASTNPVDNALRQGLMADVMPTDFPAGQGFEFSGTVDGVGTGIAGFAPGDEVFGRVVRRAQADYVVVEPTQLTHKPAGTSWEAAATIPGAAATAYAAVRAVSPEAGETVVISAATGGVGVVATQLALLAGARVIGTASERNAEFLHELGAIAVQYGDGLADRLRQAAPHGIDAYVDNFGDDNVRVAIELGVAPHRVNTIADFAAPAQYGVRSDAQAEANSPEVWAELAELIANGKLTVPIQAVYPLEQVREACDEVAKRHTRGKIVLRLVDSA